MITKRDGQDNNVRDVRNGEKTTVNRKEWTREGALNSVKGQKKKNCDIISRTLDES